jgi:hypothetical protein
MRTPSVTNEMVDDILSTALDGITYWATRAEIVGEAPGAKWASDALTRGGALRISIFEDKPRMLTLAAFQRGIRAAARHRGLTVEAFYETHDAGDADLAVQFALFRTVVYG